MNKTVKDIYYREREEARRPEAIERLLDTLNHTRLFLLYAQNQSDHATEDTIMPWTDAEVVLPPSPNPACC